MGWWDRLAVNPFGTMVAVAAVVLGALGIIIGDGVSQGMTNSLAGHANLVAHFWGSMFCIGGLLKLYGLYTHRVIVELPGLYMVGGGYAFYSLTVLTGLGSHGLAAGVISGSLTIGCLVKAHLIMARARQVRFEIKIRGGEGG